jgi:hypothetical protein
VVLGYIPVNMPVEKKFSNLQSFGRIVEMMSFVDGLPEMSAEEIEEAAHRMCELPADPERTMSMEEVVFWAGVATGMEICKSMQEDVLDGSSAEKIQAYSSLLAYSTKNALVDLTLEQLEPSKEQLEPSK